MNFDIIILTGFSVQAELQREQLGVFSLWSHKKIRLMGLELEKKKNQLWDIE